jgi:hypothetical protein
LEGEKAMKRLVLFIAVLTATALLLSESGYSQDKKADQPPAAKAALPQGWGKLGIQGDQKKAILTVIGNYQSKINALKDQMDSLKKEEYQEAYKLLTDAQKDTLKKIALDKVEPPTKDKTDDKKDDKKKGG